MEIAQNRAIWLEGKAPYQALPALESNEDADIAIIGGGFTGVSTAYHVAGRFPDRRIVLLEARQLGSGASGQNGGLMLNGAGGAVPGDLEQWRRIYDTTREGIDGIVSIIREHRLDVRHRRDGALDVLTDARRADHAAAWVERVRGAGIPLEYLSGAALERLVRMRGAVGAIRDPTAGHLDGLDFVRAMRPVLLERGVRIFESTPVVSIREGPTIELVTTRGAVRARAIVLGTNAYTPSLGYFRSGLLPLHSHLVATEPLSASAWEEIGWSADLAGFSDDMDRLAYGCMTTRGELVFGGGSNAAYDYVYGGRTTFPGSADRAFAAIRRHLVRYLPRAADVRVTHRWTGPVALTMSRVCTMGVMGEHRNVYYALGYSGHGITLANLAGRVLSDVYAGDDARWRGLPFYEQRLHALPPEPLRWIGYHVYTSLTGRSPRRSLR